MVKDRISELVRNIGGNPDDVNAANAVRVAPNPIVSSDSGLMMWLVAGVFGVLFMFCGYLLIYNVFEIAVTNDIRQYGLLRTVGTTSRQIRRLVNRQALYLFLIGTPLGLLLGTLLGRSILPAALQIFAVDFSGGNIEVGTPIFGHYRRCDPVLRAYGLYQHQKVGKESFPCVTHRGYPLCRAGHGFHKAKKDNFWGSYSPHGEGKSSAQ